MMRTATELLLLPLPLLLVAEGWRYGTCSQSNHDLWHTNSVKVALFSLRLRIRHTKWSWVTQMTGSVKPCKKSGFQSRIKASSNTTVTSMRCALKDCQSLHYESFSRLAGRRQGFSPSSSVDKKPLPNNLITPPPPLPSLLPSSS